MKQKSWQGMQPSTRKFKKLMKRERALMLKGKGAFAEAQAQLEDEAAEEFYRSFKPMRRRKKTHRRNRWSERNAEMLYNRGIKRKGKG